MGVAVLLLVACGDETPQAPACPAVASAAGDPGSVFADPEVLHLDAATPFYDAAGCGSVLLLDGWGRVELHEEGSYVWAQAEEVTVEVPRPLDADGGELGDFVLTLDVGALLRADQPQAVEVHSASRRLGRHELDDGWNRVEVEIPGDALSEPWNELTFRFEWATSPKSLGQSEDSRTLAAAVSRISLRPATSTTSPLASLERQGDATLLRLPPGAVVTWPLPRRTSFELEFPAATADGAVCDPSVWLLAGNEAKDEADWRWSDGSPRSLEIAVATGPGWSRLALGCAEDTTTEDLVLRLPEDAPRWTRLETPEAAADQKDPSDPPDIFLYLVDTVRADSLSVYGGSHPTPHLARLAEEGVVYHQAWTASTWTLPATVSLLTGVTPAQHGVTTGHRKLSQSSVVPLAERLDARGFFTLGLSQSLVASERFGVDRGFDRFRLDNHLGSSALRSSRLRRLFLRYLFSNPEANDAPLFVYLHSVDPHSPYRPTDGFEAMAGEGLGPDFHKRYDPHEFNLSEPGPSKGEVETMRRLYDAEVAWADQQFGRFLALLHHLDLYGGSFVAFTSDHGEEFGDHGAFGHGRTVYEEQLRVPLVVRFPSDRHAGTEVETPVSTMDLAPTILSLVQSARPNESVSRNLAGHPLRTISDNHEKERWILGVVSPMAAPPLREVDYVALRRGDLKCIRANLPFDQFGSEIPRWQVFDLATDPAEQSPLPEDDPRVGSCLEAWKSLIEDPALLTQEGGLRETDEETLEELRALGYIGDGNE